MFRVSMALGFSALLVSSLPAAAADSRQVTFTKDVEPFLDAANKNTPPTLRVRPDGQGFTGAPNGIAEKFNAAVGVPLAITVWASDEGPKINVPEPSSRCRGRGAAGRGAAGDIPPEFQPPPPLALSWTKFRGPGDVKFDNQKPAIDKNDKGKSTVNATFGAPGDYILRVEGNDSTGVGGGGFQCCWTNAYVGVTVKPAGGTGGYQGR